MEETQQRWQRIVGIAEPHRGGRFAALDGYRALAAIGVLVYHVAGNARLTTGGGPVAPLLANLGNFGVAVFFLLSGFLLYRPFADAGLRPGSTPRWGRFWRHRLLRIYPAYWVALTAYIWLIGLRMEINVENMATIYLLAQTYRPYFGFAALSVAWTLCIEVSFYVALPFIAWAIRRGIGARARSARAALQAQLLGIAALVVFAYTYRVTVAAQATGPGDNQHLWLPNYLDWFGLGMLLAIAVVWRDLGHPLPRSVQVFADRAWACWGVAGAAYVILAMVRTGVEGDVGGFGKETALQMCVRFFFNGAAAFFLLLPAVLGVREPSAIRRVLSMGTPAFLGSVSYGIYLWHKTWLDWLKGTQQDQGIAFGWGFWPTLVAVFVLTVIVSTLSYLLVERPILRFKDPRRLRRAEAAP